MWRLLLLVLAWPVAAADFRVLEGHGGPVMAAAVSPDGRWGLTASFDNALGLWELDGEDVLWLDGHRAAVKSVLFYENGAASGGDDFDVLLWDLEAGTVRHRLTGHQGPVVDLSVAGGVLASAGWGGAIGLWDTETGAHLGWMKGHRGPVNAVVFAEDGARLISASQDGTIRIWDMETRKEIRVLVRHGFGVNRLILNEAGGWLAYGAVDGGTRAVSFESGAELADLTLDRRPILAMAATADFSRIAVGDGEGYIMVVDTTDWRVIRDFHAAKAGPVWALAYVDGDSVIAGGIDDTAYVYPLEDEKTLPQMTKEKRAFHVDPDTVPNGERQFLRKCSVCHSLTENGPRRAGPNLAGLFGRKAGSRADYRYSEAVSRSNLIWDADTIDRLFDLGPDAYIPGTKMPMQRIANPDDRVDLIEYLREKTRN